MNKPLTDAELDDGYCPNCGARVNPAAITELRALRERDADWTEREAAICPEDRGFDEVITWLRKQNAALESGMGAFRQQLRSALFPFWPNNMGVGGDEIVDAVRRAVEQSAALVTALEAEMCQQHREGMPLVIGCPGQGWGKCPRIHIALARVRGAE